jgi:ribosome-associated protein
MENMMEFELQDDYIELYKLLKVMDIIHSGGGAKKLIEDEIVFRDGELETRKRAKITKGETITIADISIKVI